MTNGRWNTPFPLGETTAPFCAQFAHTGPTPALRTFGIRIEESRVRFWKGFSFPFGSFRSPPACECHKAEVRSGMEVLCDRLTSDAVQIATQHSTAETHWLGMGGPTMVRTLKNYLSDSLTLPGV